MRERLVVAGAAALSCAHAVWLATHAQGIPSPDVAHYHALALHAARAWSKWDAVWLALATFTAVPNPGVVPTWMGLWMALFGQTVAVAVASLVPFHWMLADGLWRGGRALGGRAGAAWALGVGLAAPGILTYAGQVLLDFPLAACAAFAAGALLDTRHGRAGVGLAMAALGKLSALPVLAWMAIDALWHGRRRVLPGALAVALFYVPHVGALLDYAGDSGGAAPNPAAATTLGARFAFHLESGVALAQPALLAGVILALLVRGDLLTLRVCGWALGVLAGLVPLAFFAQVRYMLPAVPLLAIAGGGAAGTPLGRKLLGGLGLVAALQLAAAHTDRVGWPGTPAALRPTTGAPYDVDAVLDWLVAHRVAPPGDTRLPARVAIHIAGSDRLHFGLFAVRSLERGLPLELMVVDDHRPLAGETDLGVVITIPGQPTVREGWRAQLPPATESWSWPDGYTVALYDRGLPPESLLDADDQHAHPVNQGLYVYDGGEAGPLLAPASSATVVKTADGYDALYVRDQAVWRANSADGRAFATPAPLTDADGAAIAAFDPDVVTLPDGTLRLFAAALADGPTNVDPATHPTRILSWRGPLDHLVRDAGERLAGTGLVDPAVAIRPDGTWEMYLTQNGRRIVRATSSDGETFTPDPVFAWESATVPMVAGEWLVSQRQVMGRSVLQAALRTDPAHPRLLEICGTGPSFVDGRLYYTRDESCPEPVVLPARRAAWPWVRTDR